MLIKNVKVVKKSAYLITTCELLSGVESVRETVDAAREYQARAMEIMRAEMD